jgi:hypothetical protein
MIQIPNYFTPSFRKYIVKYIHGHVRDNYFKKNRHTTYKFKTSRKGKNRNKKLSMQNRAIMEKKHRALKKRKKAPNNQYSSLNSSN